MNTLLAQYQAQIRQLCQRYGVERLDLFGPAVTERFEAGKSDFDFIVRFRNPDQPGISRRYFGLAEELETVLQHPVDLLTDKPFTNPYFAESVAQTCQVIYDQNYEEPLV